MNPRFRRPRRAPAGIRIAPLLRTLVLAVVGPVACSADATAPGGHGYLEVVITSDGVDLDPDGYALTIGSRSPISVATLDTIIVDGLGRGRVTAALEDMTINCTVQGDNPTDIDVSGIGPTFFTFDVECIRNEGDLAINVEVTGPVGDPSGFEVSVAGVGGSVNGNSETFLFENIRGGEHEMTVENLATFCRVLEPSTVVVQPLELTTVDLTVECAYSVVGRILFSAQTDGFRLYTVAPDGSDLVPFGDHSAVNQDQLRSSISRDGSRIVFWWDRRDIYAIDPDGTNMRPVPNGVNVSTPKISPDGQQIAFARHGDIWIMDFDGSNTRQITDGIGQAHSPDWSPDGRRLAFEVDLAPWDIYVIGVDGTGLTPLVETGGDDLDPAFSPDGTELAFHTNAGGPTIMLAAADGSDPTPLAESGWDPSWSADGTRLAFHNDDPPFGITVLDVATGETTPVSSGGLPEVHAVHTAWGPSLP